MKSWKKILIVLVVLLLGFIGLLAGHISTMSRPTEGELIAEYETPQKALLVIDIQEDFTGSTAKSPFPYKNAEGLIDSVNIVQRVAVEKDIPIVYIRHEIDSFVGKLISNLFVSGAAIKGKPGTEIDKRVLILSNDLFTKSRSDAFSNPELDEFLIKHHVNELILVGLDAGGCVHRTAQGALSRGYRVKIITDAIALLAEEKWDELLEEYQQEGIVLLSCSEF